LHSFVILGLPLTLFFLTLAYFFAFKRSTIAARQKAYWKGINVPCSLVAVLSFLLLAFSGYQNEQKQRFDMLRWKASVAGELAQWTAGTTQARWCQEQSGYVKRDVKLSSGQEVSVQSLCEALNTTLLSDAPADRLMAYQGALKALETLPSTLITKAEVAGMVTSLRRAERMAAEVQVMPSSGRGSGALVNAWGALLLSCFLALSAAVRVVSVYAEWKIQLLEDADKNLDFKSTDDLFLTEH
jgi:hypothetical protein